MVEVVLFHGVGGLSATARRVFSEAFRLLQAYGYRFTGALVQLPVTDDERKPVLVIDGFEFTIEDYDDIEIAVDLVVETLVWEDEAQEQSMPEATALLAILG